MAENSKIEWTDRVCELEDEKGLRDAGVKLSEGQAELAQKLMDTGRTAEAQKLVLDELAASVQWLTQKPTDRRQ